MTLDSLQALYTEELQDLYNAENQLVEALPKMAVAATSSNLRKAFEDHLKQTEGHVRRLEKVLEALEEKPGGKICKAMKGLVAEAQELLKEEADDAVRDAGLIACAQRVEHYEMAGYGCVRTYAKLLGFADQSRELQKTLDEEGEADHKLTKLAETEINISANKAYAK